MSRPIVILAERRLGKLLLLFLAAFVVMLGRLFQLQFVEASKYEERVDEARTFRVPIPPRRGGIYDREGRMLAESVERFQVTLFPNSFRENNRIDALQDLVAAYLPELLSGDDRRPLGRTRLIEAREERFRAVYELRHRAVPALLSLATTSLRLERPVLMQRLERQRYPQGELILPPSQLARRLENAILLLADNEVCGSRRMLQLRLAESTELGEAMSTSAERVIAGIEREYLELNKLAHDVAAEDPFAFWTKLFSQERRNIERMERRVGDDLDDQICKVEFGSHELDSVLDTDERRAIASRLGLESRSRSSVAEAFLAWQRRAQADELDDDEQETFALLREIVDGRSVELRESGALLPKFEDYEVRALASQLGLWDDDPARIKRAFGQSVRERDDFAEKKAEYLSPEKEWRRILQHRDGVPYQLFDGCEFAVANRVWESFGLRELGFSVRASEGRRYWEDEIGVASLLIGRCNRRGRPLGGLEASLSRSPSSSRSPSDAEEDEVEGEELEIAGLFDDTESLAEKAPLTGRPGYLLRRRELDRSYTTLPNGREPVQGADVRLTIDRELQKLAEELAAEMRQDLGAGGGAAIAVVDIESGDIIVLASAPRLRGVDYLERYLKEGALRRQRTALSAALRDGAITKAEYRNRDAALRLELEDLVLYDRASSAGTASQCPPGSVLKVIAAMGMLQDGVFRPDEIVPDPKKGPVDFRRAVEVSSNYYFWEGARRWGVTKLVDWYSAFGLGHPIPFLVTKSDGEARRRDVRGDAAKNIVIGQGSMNLSALEVATMMMNLARRGQLLVPRIILSVDGIDQPAQERGEVRFESRFAEPVFDAMEQVARKSMDRQLAEGLGIAGKTGTAELGGRYKGLYNAWFAGFAPRQAPRYAFAIVAERTALMGKATAPYAGRMMKLLLGAER